MCCLKTIDLINDTQQALCTIGSFLPGWSLGEIRRNLLVSLGSLIETIDISFNISRQRKGTCSIGLPSLSGTRNHYHGQHNDHQSAAQVHQLHSLLPPFTHRLL
jgi:hypothetical protein